MKNEINPLRPLPIKLDGGSEKELLTQNLDEGSIPRTWSTFYQTDPVELSRKRVVTGKTEFSCDYAGRVFLFDSEENLNLFMETPKKFINNVPKMPETYNIAIVGPRQSGKKTLANIINELYKWKIIDIEKIITDKIVDQKSWANHKPSNPEPRVKFIS
jgi:adenylate/nucleoside-diphosphate kinase